MPCVFPSRLLQLPNVTANSQAKQSQSALTGKYTRWVPYFEASDSAASALYSRHHSPSHLKINKTSPELLSNGRSSSCRACECHSEWLLPVEPRTESA